MEKLQNKTSTVGRILKIEHLGERRIIFLQYVRISEGIIAIYS